MKIGDTRKGIRKRKSPEELRFHGVNTRNPRVGKVGENPDCVNFLCVRAHVRYHVSRHLKEKWGRHVRREPSSSLKLLHFPDSVKSVLGHLSKLK